MLEFFIALFGGLFYGGKAAKEACKEADYKRKQAVITENATNIFLENTDPSLEGFILVDLQQAENREELLVHAHSVLNDLNAWRNYSVSSADLDELALDIILAEHGKVPIKRFHTGYEGYRTNNTDEENARKREFAEWVARTVRNNGATIELYRQGIRSSIGYDYVWKNSYAYLPDLQVGPVLQ